MSIAFWEVCFLKIVNFIKVKRSSSYTFIYLKERNCLRDKFSRFSRVFSKFVKLNPREKSLKSQFAKIIPCEKKIFLCVSELAKLRFFILGSLSINDGHVKNILQGIKQN